MQDALSAESRPTTDTEVLTNKLAEDSFVRRLILCSDLTYVAFRGAVTESSSPDVGTGVNGPVAGATVITDGSLDGAMSFTTDASGNFSGVYSPPSTPTAYASKWGLSTSGGPNDFLTFYTDCTFKATLAAVEATAVAEVEARDLAKKTLHYGSTGDWLTHTGGLRRGHGRRIVKHALALTGPLTATLEALTAGVVSPEQAGVVADAIDQLPTGQRVRRAGESHLLGHAGSLNASELARAGRHLVRVVDPEGEDRKLGG